MKHSSTGRRARILWLGALAFAVSSHAQAPTTLRDAATPHPLWIGAAADASDASPDPLTAEPAYGATLAAQFNMLEGENAMKWGLIHPNPPGSANEYNFAPGDELVSFAEAHGMAVRGHNLLWHSYNPAWLTSGGYTSTQLSQILQNHITTVVSHYKGKVFAWDVVNEAMGDSGTLRDSIWYNQPGIGLSGTGYVEQAFRWAHAADPDALLFYNDYGIEDQYCYNGSSAGPDGGKFQAVYDMVKDFVARAVPIDGVGFQMHIDTNGCPTSAVLADHFQKIAALGLQVHITEMDVKIPDTSAASLQAQAATYQRILNVCLQSPGCTAFQTWGFTDRHTWLPDNFPLPFDTNYQPKPAFNALLNGLIAALPAPESFIPVTPCRVADTRGTDGPFGGPTMTAGSIRSFAIPQSACGIPSTARAYSLNVTVVPQGPLSYLTLWPTGQSRPLVSTLNSWGGTVTANAAIVPAGTGGAVSVFVTNPTDVILDINGYFDSSPVSGSYSFYPVSPCRVADTRNADGPFGGPTLPAGGSRDFAVSSSNCSIPNPPGAYSMNVTVVPSGYLGYLTAWPTGQTRPNVSTLNSWQGKVVANAAIVPAGTNESISLYASNPTDAVLDINGYFGLPGNTGALSFYPVTPCRVADTRGPEGPFGGPILEAGTSRSFAIPASECRIPSTAAAYSVNVTVVPDGPLPYLTAWPTESAQPFVSTLNSWDGTVVANAAIVPAGTDGAISVYVTGRTHVILDINGYFAP
jgi:endo-1,4-beta-xylanase